MIIENNSLEVLRTCSYEKNEILGRYVSNNLYLSIVATNACQKNCPYCINSLTNKSLSLPIEKAKINIKKAINMLGVKEAVILGGEPTLYGHIFELIEFLKCSRLRKFGLTTNGLKLKSHDFLVRLVQSGIDFINISLHKNGEFLTLDELSDIRRTFIEHRTDGQKMRINTNIWKGNHDSIDSISEFINSISDLCDEIRVSNIIHKDDFSVNPLKVDEADGMYMSDEEYENIFRSLIRKYENDYTIIHNNAALGFVNYYLIPTKCPIIINWNIDSKVSEQVCENNFGKNKIHTIKCLVTGDLSLSWNTNYKINLSNI